MRKAFAISLLILTGLSHPAAQSETTIRGELVCQTCYLKDHTNIGPDHAACQKICTKRGAPIAVLTPDGRTYVVTGDLVKDNSARLQALAGQFVEVVGHVVTRVKGRDVLLIEGRDIKPVSRPR